MANTIKLSKRTVDFFSSRRKYNSIWQVLTSRNDLQSKYELMEKLIDGIVKESHDEDIR